MLTVLHLLTARPAMPPRGIGRVHKIRCDAENHTGKRRLSDDMLVQAIAGHQAREGTEIYLGELAEMIEHTHDVTGDRLRRLMGDGRIYRTGRPGQYRYGVLPGAAAMGEEQP